MRSATMPAKDKLIEIERREGKPIIEILNSLYETYDKQSEVAQVLGVHQSTISGWIARLGLRQRTILIPRDDQACKIR
jgi:predicted XRE-type DNA-binding protein